MIGGDEEDVSALTPIFRAVSSRSTHIGAVGAGQVSKACNQLMVALHIQAAAEALALAQHCGVDAHAVREAILGGLGASRVLEVHGRRMLEGDHAPGFRLSLHVKDVRIVKELASEVSAAVPILEAVGERMEALALNGGGELDHSALWLTVKAGSGDPAA